MKSVNIPATFWLTVLFFITTSAIMMGCAASEAKPVDIFSEDMCSNCRMAISDPAFASEIITDKDVFKFDDLGCLESFKNKHKEMSIVATFVKDYETKHWLRFDQSKIVITNITTPMGSGKVAFADSTKAIAFAQEHAIAGKKKPMSCSCCTETE